MLIYQGVGKNHISSASLNFLWLQEEDWEGPNGTRLWGWAMQPVKEAEEFPQLGTEKTAAPWPEMDAWVVVSNAFYFYCYPYLEKWSNLTNIFQMGWNHHLDVNFDEFSGNVWICLMVFDMLDT